MNKINNDVPSISPKAIMYDWIILETDILIQFVLKYWNFIQNRMETTSAYTGKHSLYLQINSNLPNSNSWSSFSNSIL